MYKLFVVFALVGAIIAAPTQQIEFSTVRECLNEMLDSIDSGNILNNLGEAISNTRQTFAYLIERYRRCQDLPRDDPPTRPQEIAIAACESAWRLNVAMELTRLTAAINGHIATGIDLIAQFTECTGIALVQPEEYDVVRAS